jgi:hypothetical protein
MSPVFFCRRFSSGTAGKPGSGIIVSE